MADIFISYTSSDSHWARWLHGELTALGHAPHIHEWEIGAGDDIYAWMERRHDAADHVLCVVSDAYMAAPYSTIERNAALWAAASKRPGFVLFAVVEPCRLPTLADHIRRCELFGVPEEAAKTRFRDFMAKREAPNGPASFPGRVFALSNVPIRTPEHFMGRDDALAAIETGLARYEGRVAITALHGLRGVGKTTLAAAFAERMRERYRAIWWIRAATPEGMRADLVGLGVRLGWVAADAKEEPALADVMERLVHEGEGVLLVYDNAVSDRSLRPFLPKGGAARVLVTSNSHSWRGLAEPVEIRLWPRKIGADYLLARTGGGDGARAAAEKLSEALGGLPLAHEQAAAYCERLSVSLADYVRRFEKQPAKLLDTAGDAPAEYHDGLTVAKTFALAIGEAAKLHPAAEPLITHAAHLASEPIPLFLFSDGREALDEPLKLLLENDGLDEALAALSAFALIDREAVPDERDPSIVTPCFRLHRLIRQVAGGRGEADTIRNTLVGVLAHAYPEGAYSDPAAWVRCRRLDAHGVDLARAEDGADGPDAARLLDGLASFRHGALAAYRDAKPLFERTLAIDETVLGPDHLHTATSLNNLAGLLQEMGDLLGARPLFERALAMREKALGPDHPHTAVSLNNLALLLRDMGDLPAARPLLEHALTIWEEAFGPDHPTTAKSLANLALLLQAMGDLQGAQPLYERALAIHETALGPDHPDTASSLNNLACLLRDVGDRSKAEPYFRRAIVIVESRKGREHPDIATHLSNLACLLRDEGRSEEAENLFREAITNGTRALGEDHPLTRRFESHYARLLVLTDRAAEALLQAEAALARHAETNGETHPWTRDSGRVAADALDALGRSDEAAAIRERYKIGAAA